jgi:hypothetical protein
MLDIECRVACSMLDAGLHSGCSADCWLYADCVIAEWKAHVQAIC